MAKVPKTITASEPIEEVKKITEPIGQKNVAGIQINPAIEDTLTARVDQSYVDNCYVEASIVKMLGFSGAVYENEDTATTDDPRRFETSSKKLRDLIIQVSGNDQLFGNVTNQRYKVAVGEAIGFTRVDLSLLYFKNAAAGQNGTVNILGVEE